MKKRLAGILRSRKGATAIEYGLIAAMFSVAAIAAFRNFASGERSIWSHVENQVTNAMGDGN
jgi:pilus assembly protein Flp/PilA